MTGNAGFGNSKSGSGLPATTGDPAEVRRRVSAARAGGARTVGFVPTMGALHEGHARLMEACRAGSDYAVASIFVNPTQFGPGEDFGRYPRTPEADLEVCRAAGIDLVFAPEAGSIYKPGHDTFVEVGRLGSILEGASRPGHFRGVATVVLKLFHIVRPDRAWFGLKDYQQVAVLRRMASDFDLDVEIVAAETFREPDGLAMSSRNRYLDPGQRIAARALSAALRDAAALAGSGERDARAIRRAMRERIAAEPAAELDYAEVADAETLEPLERLEPGRRAVALIAARVGPARLIDNALLPPGGSDPAS